jgi:hypothetical protein
MSVSKFYTSFVSNHMLPVSDPLIHHRCSRIVETRASTTECKSRRYSFMRSREIIYTSQSRKIVSRLILPLLHPETSVSFVHIIPRHLSSPYCLFERATARSCKSSPTSCDDEQQEYRAYYQRRTRSSNVSVSNPGLTILLAFQNWTTLMTFFKKQIGPVTAAKIWGQVSCLKNQTIKLVHPGKAWISRQAFSG